MYDFQVLSNVLDYLNPLRYVSHDQYVSIWQLLFASVLHGFWARLIAWSCLVFAFIFGVVRQNIGFAIVLFAIAICVTYCGAVVGWLFTS